VTQYLNGIPPEFQPVEHQSLDTDDTWFIVHAAEAALRSAQWPAAVIDQMHRQAWAATSRAAAIEVCRKYVRFWRI
jgi:hypothetical protein